VKTAAPGTTLYAGEQKGYGLIVIVEHADGLVTLYAHNRDVRVKTGQKVREGQVVATVGDSGKTSGPHLHFEVRSRCLAPCLRQTRSPAPRSRRNGDVTSTPARVEPARPVLCGLVARDGRGVAAIRAHHEDIGVA
jgi:murein DD-endopeptidase MepM/ murein hydrolase activator NlpD